MGAHANIRISRTAAIRYLIERVFDSPDQDLRDMLDMYLSKRLYTSTIVRDGEDCDDEIL